MLLRGPGTATPAPATLSPWPLPASPPGAEPVGRPDLLSRATLPTEAALPTPGEAAEQGIGEGKGRGAKGGEGRGIVTAAFFCRYTPHGGGTACCMLVRSPQRRKGVSSMRRRLVSGREGWVQSRVVERFKGGVLVTPKKSTPRVS